MAIGKGNYAMKKTKSGAEIRLHFTPTGKVNEVKNMKTGKTHTAAEFKADRKKAAMRKRAKKK